MSCKTPSTQINLLSYMSYWASMDIDKMEILCSISTLFSFPSNISNLTSISKLLWKNWFFYLEYQSISTKESFIRCFFTNDHWIFSKGSDASVWVSYHLLLFLHVCSTCKLMTTRLVSLSIMALGLFPNSANFYFYTTWVNTRVIVLNWLVFLQFLSCSRSGTRFLSNSIHYFLYPSFSEALSYMHSCLLSIFVFISPPGALFPSLLLKITMSAINMHSKESNPVWYIYTEEILFWRDKCSEYENKWKTNANTLCNRNEIGEGGCQCQ